MLACHAGGPGSIPGRCNCFGNYVSMFLMGKFQEIALHKSLKHIRCGLVVRICGSHPQGRGSIPRNGSFFLRSSIQSRIVSPLQMSVNQKSALPSPLLLEKVRPTRSSSPTFSTSWAFGRVKSTLIRYLKSYGFTLYLIVDMRNHYDSFIRTCTITVTYHKPL